jgi:hypothetical protein
MLGLNLTSSRTSPTEQTMILDTPNDIAERFSLLTFEMADPEQDLSVQQPGYGATTFTCFPKLALELRLMIWRAAFPRGRMVEVLVQVVGYDSFGPPLPSTLMINQESRKETLRHYLLYYQDDELLNRVPEFGRCLRSTRDLRQPRPVCYSPGRDLLFVTYCFAHQSSTDALLELVAEKCKVIGKVRVLATDYFSCFARWRGVDPNSKPLGFPVVHDLKEICCVIHPDAHAPGDEWHKSDIIEAFGKAFDLEREKHPGHNKPRISFFDSMHDLQRNMWSKVC